MENYKARYDVKVDYNDMLVEKSNFAMTQDNFYTKALTPSVSIMKLAQREVADYFMTWRALKVYHGFCQFFDPNTDARFGILMQVKAVLVCKSKAQPRGVRAMPMVGH